MRDELIYWPVSPIYAVPIVPGLLPAVQLLAEREESVFELLTRDKTVNQESSILIKDILQVAHRLAEALPAAKSTHHFRRPSKPIEGW